jgi:signal transduction histidine kinase
VRITRKLGLIVTVLVVAMGVPAGLAVFGAVGQELRADRLRELVAVAGQAGVLGQELQRERAAAAGTLTGGSSADRVDGYLRQVGATDGAVAAFRRLVTRLSSLPAGTRSLLARIGVEIDGLPSLRDQVRSGRGVSLSAVTFTYRILIADLISYRDTAAQAGGAPAARADELRAAAALSQAAEAVSLEQVVVLRMLAPGARVTPAAQAELSAARTGYTEAISSFSGLAPPLWRAWLDDELAGADVVNAQRLEDLVGRVPVGTGVDLDAGEWAAAMTGRDDRLHRVEQRVDTAVDAGVEDDYGAQRSATIAQAAIVVLAVVLAVVFAVWMGRPMARRLRGLRDAARLVAFQDLPRTVAEMRGLTPVAIRELDPEGVVDRHAGVVDRAGRDEIAEVGQAFDEVHRAAIRTTAEQAVMRGNVAHNLVQFARRAQALVDRLIEQLDVLEKDETDPDRLSRLYALDNTASLMGRTNFSLLVLGGAGSGRVRRADVPLWSVLQAAVSQIEHYALVQVGQVSAEVAVVGSVVDEVVHLLALLLDNATAFSPPGRDVWVGSRAVRDSVVIEIVDQGIGLDDRLLHDVNARLASPPAVEMVALRSMGLAVVGHVAAVQGIRVRLYPGTGGVGTVAEVWLPSSILRPVHRDPPHPVTPTGSAVLASTAALPQPRLLERSGPATAQPLVPAQRVAEPQSLRPGPPAVDPGPAADTAELPIFQAVMSGWFARNPDGLPAADGSWSRADAAWETARRAADPPVGGSTVSGLPVRVPQAQLVPGSFADPSGGPVARPDPGQIAASMSAFARGFATRARGGRPPVATERPPMGQGERR